MQASLRRELTTERGGDVGGVSGQIGISLGFSNYEGMTGVKDARHRFMVSFFYLCPPILGFLSGGANGKQLLLQDSCSRVVDDTCIWPPLPHDQQF